MKYIVLLSKSIRGGLNKSSYKRVNNDRPWRSPDHLIRDSLSLSTRVRAQAVLYLENCKTGLLDLNKKKINTRKCRALSISPWWPLFDPFKVDWSVSNHLFVSFYMYGSLLSTLIRVRRTRMALKRSNIHCTCRWDDCSWWSQQFSVKTNTPINQ